MKTTLCVFCVMLTAFVNAQTNIFPSNGQAGIGTTTPNASAKLEIRSTGKGFLMPRMTKRERNAIPLPAKGLEIYQTTDTAGFYFYDGSEWKQVGADVGANRSLSNLSDISINGNLLPAAGSSFDLGTLSHSWHDLWMDGEVWCDGTGIMKINFNSNEESNVSVGGFSIQDDGVVHNSVAVGVGALFISTGSNNTALGFLAMANAQSGSGNLGLGYRADASMDSINNSTALGENATVTASNQVRVGSAGTTSIGGFVGWTKISDSRFSKNVNTNVPGLAFINQLKPVTYALDVNAINNKLKRNNTRLDKRIILKDSSVERSALLAKESITNSGFIAQDVEAVAKKMNFEFSGLDAPKNKQDVYGLRYDEFVVPLVKAVQQLSKMNDEKDSAINALQNNYDAKIELLQNEINKLKAAIVSGQSMVNSQQSAAISSSSLQQNIPNPFTHTTSIGYSINQTFTSAKIIVADKNGKTLKEEDISAKGKGSLQLDASTLASGAYSYSLFLDGRLIDTKQMLLAK